MKGMILFACLLIGACPLFAQDTSLYQRKIFIRNGDTLRYRVLYPEHAKKGKAYPLLVFLHGSGERGNDNALQLVHGGDLFVKPVVREKFPAVVIFPQCPSNLTWSKLSFPINNTEAYNRTLNTDGLTAPEQMVKLLMDSLAENGRIDKKRIYLGGLSLGGYGTYDLVIHYPDYFAAAFPICGQANVELYVRTASRLPLWIFHGGKDNVVNPQPDRDLIKALQADGIKTAKYTEYPEAGHDSWDSAFAEPGLLPWLFAQKK